MLTESQIQCVELLAQGELTKDEIAKEVKISRRTIYNWMDKDEFQKELHDRSRLYQGVMEQEGKARMLAKGQMAIDNIFKIANMAKQEKVKLDANVFIYESIFGKATSRIQDISDKETQNTNKVSEEDLKAEFTKFKVVSNDNKNDNEDKPKLKAVK